MTTHQDSSLFIRNIWQTVVVSLFFALIFILYVHSEKQTDLANEKRLHSFLLADELRQSSDDLTRMIRTYAVTKNPLYKKHYQEVLDIRNGKQPRPVEYQNIYWDLVGLEDQRPRPLSQQSFSLMDRIHQAGLSEIELAKLLEATKNSDRLTQTEYSAMKLIESKGSDREKFKRQQEALELLHNRAYHQAKASIMRPIDEFHSLMNKRTAATVHTTKVTAILLKIVFIILGFLLIFMLWRLKKILNSILGSSVSDVHEHITRIGQGDFSLPIYVGEERKESVLGWLAKTQRQLKHLVENNKRLNQLYAALSQCNQAIVRSKDETTLFQNICQNAVQIGGMKMAWIGKLDEDGRYIKPIAYFGEGTAYLDGLMISANPTDSIGCGPTGSAFHNGHPFWCQDFINDPSTFSWHERGKEFGWGASAALPLFCSGKVVGVLTLYSSQVNAFDPSTKELLKEMANDISYALEGFEHARAREKAEMTLIAEKKTAQNYLDIVDVIILVTDMNKNVQLINRKGCEIIGYTANEVIGKNWIDNFLPKQIRKERDEVSDVFIQFSDEACSYENTILTKSKKERLIAWKNIPLFSSDGKIIGLLSSGEDITERRLIQQKLYENEEFYRSIFRSVNEAILILKNNIILDCNDMALNLFETNKSELIGINILEFDFDCQENDFIHYTIAANQEQPKTIIQCSITMKNQNNRKIVEMNLSTFGNNNGKLILVARDITQRLEEEKFLKVQARQAQMGEMIAMIAHQWRQPLAIINAIASQIRLTEIIKEDEDEALVEKLIKIEEQCSHLSQTISDYRDLSNPNKLAETITISTLVQRSINLLDHTFKNNGIELRENIIQDTEVFTFHNEVIQVLLTLFKNSLDAFEDHAIKQCTITVDLDCSEEFGIISVHDNAGGISMEVMNKLFTPYFTTKNKNTGTGLGLYMSKMIIEGHCKGLLKASSQGVESIFTIKLPRSSSQFK